MRKNQEGFTLIELMLIIAIIGILAFIAIPRFISLSKKAEQASVEYEIQSLSSTLNLYSMKQLASGLPITVHNPFDDMATMSNYAGAFGDVDGTNCPAGYWAYQSGNAANGNWAVIVYRAKSSLTQAFSWGGMQWIIFSVDVVLNASGTSIGLKLTEYPPPHQW
jgi:prepilin-type N-terminal cleavage/methylation domain-containing protein